MVSVQLAETFDLFFACENCNFESGPRFVRSTNRFGSGTALLIGPGSLAGSGTALLIGQRPRSGSRTDFILIGQL